MKVLRCLLFSATAAVIAVPALAGDPPKPDPDAMMKAYIAKSMPGPAHQFLSKLAGDYTYTMTSFEDPAHPTTLTGTATKTMLMDGRYLKEETAGTMMGLPFTGMGITTYNNATKNYETVWLDNMSSSLMTCTDGKIEGNTLTMTFNYLDPVLNQTVKAKTVTQAIDDKHHTMAWLQMMPDGKEMKMFEIAYTKK